jgi:SAM-dependent methyltransferase
MSHPSSAADEWNRHWNAFGDATEQNPAQAYRRKLILDRLELDAATAPLRVLELGSGQGDLAREIRRRHPDAELLGIDVSQTGIEMARRKVPDGTFLCRDFARTLEVPSTFQRWATHAVCSEVLEHVPEPLALLENLRWCLAPRARVVITVPAGPMSAFDRHIGHLRHFSLDVLGDLLETAGFETKGLERVGFPFFNLYRLMMVVGGRRLVRGVATPGPLPVVARSAVRAFSWLFRYNQPSGGPGWQLVATVREPDGAGASRENLPVSR